MRLGAFSPTREGGRQERRMKRARRAVCKTRSGAREAQRVRRNMHVTRGALHVERHRRTKAKLPGFVFEDSGLEMLHGQAREHRVEAFAHRKREAGARVLVTGSLFEFAQADVVKPA